MFHFISIILFQRIFIIVSSHRWEDISQAVAVSTLLSTVILVSFHVLFLTSKIFLVFNMHILFGSGIFTLFHSKTKWNKSDNKL